MGVVDGKVFIVVGGARGIGRASALALAREGARLVLADNGCAPDGTGHDSSVVAECATEVRGLGAEVVTSDADVTAAGSAKALVELARASFGRVDGGFYSAGFVRERALVRMSDDDFDSVLEVHVRGAFRFTRELARALVDQREGGSIVLTASPSGFFGTALQASLAAASGAIASFTKTAALELRRQEVRVNTLVPTARTRLTQDLPLFQAIRPDSLTPEHVGQVVCHLLSDASRDVHGEIVGVAGGRVYALRMSETSGVYHDEGPVPLAELAGAFREVTRG
jgi:NAD(P)-dependent dehydrogenase (short-subunit alcohol dehydrogenase family)